MEFRARFYLELPTHREDYASEAALAAATPRNPRCIADELLRKVRHSHLANIFCGVSLGLWVVTHEPLLGA